MSNKLQMNFDKFSKINLTQIGYFKLDFNFRFLFQD